MRASSLFLTALLVSIFAAAAPAAEKAASSFDGRVASVAVFKNGYGFFRVEGAATPADGTVEISPLPPASLGTWWFYSRDENVSIARAVASSRDLPNTRPVRSLDELLLVNPGREIVIETPDRTYRGTLLKTVDLADLLPPDPRRNSSSRFGGPLHQDLLLMTEGAVVTIRRGDVRSIRIPEASTDFPLTEKEDFVTLHLSGPAGPAGPVSLGYEFLQKGIRWIPSYRIELTDDDTATIILNADCINDIHDLDSATLQLVVGVPNFLHADLLSPLSLASSLPQLSQFFQAAGGAAAGYFSNALVSQRAGAYYEERRPEPARPAAPPEGAFRVPDSITAKGVSDLFYYTVDDITLRKDERASILVLKASSPYTHVHKWTVGFDSPVGHFIRLENTSGKPLTSAPALLLHKGSILAQSLLTYTPVSDTVDVRITDAVDVKTNHWENETDRRRNALQVYGTHYDLVHARGTFTVKNFRNETLHFLATRDLDGEVSETSHDGKVDKYVTNIKNVNPHSRMEWDLSIDPGTEVIVTYDYSTYVRP